MLNGTGPAAAGVDAQPRRRVLVADDDKLLLVALTKRLEHAGYEVIPAADGAEALRLARTENPDVAILDVMLPHIDGFDLCRRLKERPPPGRPRIVMLSAIASGTGKSDEEMRKRAGADAFFSKPCRFSDLLQELAPA